MKTDFYLDVALAVVLFALLVDVFAGGGHYATYLWAASLALSALDLTISRGEANDVVVTLLLTVPVLAPEYAAWLYVAAFFAQLGDVLAG